MAPSNVSNHLALKAEVKVNQGHPKWLTRKVKAKATALEFHGQGFTRIYSLKTKVKAKVITFKVNYENLIQKIKVKVKTKVTVSALSFKAKAKIYE